MGGEGKGSDYARSPLYLIAIKVNKQTKRRLYDINHVLHEISVTIKNQMAHKFFIAVARILIFMKLLCTLCISCHPGRLLFWIKIMIVYMPSCTHIVRVKAQCKTLRSVSMIFINMQCGKWRLKILYTYNKKISVR